MVVRGGGGGVGSGWWDFSSAVLFLVGTLKRVGIDQEGIKG